MFRHLFIVCFVFLIGQSFSQTRFKDVTDSAGIKHVFKVYEGMFGGGACVVDYNNDGFEDVYITGGMNDDVLYKNNGNGTFTNVFEQSGLSVTKNYVTQGVSSADVNRDGFVDLFITTITSRNKKQAIPREINLLFLNNGNGTFRDATKEYGLDQMYSFSTGGSFGDFNADGWADIYVGNYFNQYEGKLSVINDATVVGANQIAKGYLLLNESGKKFKDVYGDYGLDYRGFGFGGVFTDYDNDGDQDLIVNHDFGYKRTPDMLLQNQYPKEKFVDVAKENKMDLRINSMGTAVGDYNNDGLMDYYFTNIKFNMFMVNQGPGKSFIEKTSELGLGSFAISWGANFADFDHDGDVDLFVSNGDLNPDCHPMADFYFENNNGKFTDKASAYGLADYGIGRGSVVFDYDNDGDLDLLVVNQEAVYPNYPVPSITRLYRNDSAKGNWIKIALQGIQAESHGIGSKIEVEAGGKKMIREIDGGSSSHLSQNSVIAHFGLGNAITIDKITVYWTGGNKQTITNIKPNQLITIKEIPIPVQKRSNSLIYILIGVACVGLIAFIFLRKRKVL
ncbi:CRTAC1 family protein [Panacibacter ginsenosidivorans]|uniref:CRTAC1 family protein n=1 Tax=Panacibacter ginsenosidivorans TaxID=1813871 RepID=A0A5B8V644_9BACT|nr:CRTAC1 family protein [Panacibacter ginsenosidivorans]QEC66565.1 CRTAC1 family protein [Panacibacter ginsenosidivorans]